MARTKPARTGIWETEYKPLPKPDSRPFEGPPPYVGYRNPAPPPPPVRQYDEEEARR